VPFLAGTDVDEFAKFLETPEVIAILVKPDIIGFKVNTEQKQLFFEMVLVAIKARFDLYQGQDITLDMLDTTGIDAIDFASIFAFFKAQLEQDSELYSRREEHFKIARGFANGFISDTKPDFDSVFLFHILMEALENLKIIYNRAPQVLGKLIEAGATN